MASEQNHVRVTDPESAADFMKLQDDQIAILQEEVEALELRGRRLRRAAFSAGVSQSVSVLCSAYVIFAVRWSLLDWSMLDKTIYNIQANWTVWNIGVFAETIGCVTNTLVGVLLGMIVIGAGVNAASSSMIILFKLMEQVIVGVSIVNLILVGVFVDENNALSSTIKYYYYSDAFPQTGMQITYVLLLMNRYGVIFSQIFSGLHYSFLGWIISMWGVFPRHLGYALSIAGPCHIVNVFLNLFIPQYNDELAIILALPGIIAQFWLAAWMLVNTPHPSKNRGATMLG
eukprot:scaffold2299_cov131-Cylindrotheca_fusiformis.AAC.5